MYNKRESEEVAAKIRALQETLREKLGAEADRICPRCGNMSMRSHMAENALSRRIDVYICAQCGTEEAIADYIKESDTTAGWYITNLPELTEEEA